MVISVVWVSWTLARQAKELGITVRRYAPFWLAAVGGSIATIGVLLPHVDHGTRPIGTTLIIIGMIILLTGSVASIVRQRRCALVAAH